MIYACSVCLIDVALLDDLDKELNNYNMKCREWYGWHFPELGKLVPDNLTYVRTVKAIGNIMPNIVSYTLDVTTVFEMLQHAVMLLFPYRYEGVHRQC